MGKIKKFAQLNLRKLTGGKDPLRIVEEFILRRGFDPDECQKDKKEDVVRWVIEIHEGAELEILLEGLKKPSETTIYMGINVVIVPIRGSADLLAAALEIADGLIGVKISLVGHFLVLSASLGAAGVTVEDIDYNFRLIEGQQAWFREALITELSWETDTE